MPLRLGESLLGDGRLTSSQLGEALERQRQLGGRLGTHLAALGFATASQIAGALSRQYGVPAVSFAHCDVDPGVLSLVPAGMARRFRALPLARTGASVIVAMSDPTNVAALDDLRFMTGCTVEPVVAAEEALLDALDRYYGAPPAGPDRDGDGVLALATRALEGMPASAVDAFDVAADPADITVDTLARPDDEAPIVRLVNLLLVSAIRKGASDIHIEPYDRELRVRYRIDGALYEVMSPPSRSRDAIAARIKIMAKLDIAEKRLPQDGRMKVRFQEGGHAREIDVRVSSLPTLFGERLVLRLLDRDALALDLAALGFEPESLAAFESAIRRPWGMVLVTGPTGSGKTSTLYSSIARLNTAGVNILTAEDPIEFNLPGVNQLQVRDGIGLTFAAALRSFLRQDPNVILVGEIRDGETAEIAVKAALTGHLVLSTLHTNDAPGSVARLLNMGIEPFLVAGSLNLVCAQRLVRRVCRHCLEPQPVPEGALVQAGFPRDEAASVIPRRGRGCHQCSRTGFRGRVGLFEAMELTDSLRGLILAGAPAARLRSAALEAGMVTLRQSGLRKVRAGVTSLEEVVRETVA